jgi:hypothetical protein
LAAFFFCSVSRIGQSLTSAGRHYDVRKRFHEYNNLTVLNLLP